MREQISGAKVLMRNIFFSLEIVGADEGALLRELITGAPSYVPAFMIRKEIINPCNAFVHLAIY